MKKEDSHPEHDFNEQTYTVRTLGSHTQPRMPFISMQPRYDTPEPNPDQLLESIAQVREINGRHNPSKKTPRGKKY